MDPISTAVIAWATGEVGTAGVQGLRELLLGDKQQNALRAVVLQAVSSAVQEVVPASQMEDVQETLTREYPHTDSIGASDILDLPSALTRVTGPRLAVLAGQGYKINTAALIAALAKFIVAGVQADADRAGPLAPLAERLRHERLAAAAEHAVAELRKVNRALTASAQAAQEVPHVRQSRRPADIGHSGPLGWPIASLNPEDALHLEVHPSIDVGASYAELSVLPAYIERAHDHELRKITARAASGHSAIAVLVGASSTGKTRACWEAVQSLPPDWRLWHPIDPGKPEALSAGLSSPDLAPRTVIWLNEIQHYLAPSDKTLAEHIAAGLRELLRSRSRSPVLILGTIWPEYWNALTNGPESEVQGGRSQASALVEGTEIHVSTVFDRAALGKLHARAAHDPRLARASAHARYGLITQFLAGAPFQVERYKNAPLAARAIIEAAMDARRLGCTEALPQELLRLAAPGYLNDYEWNTLEDSWFKQALEYSSEGHKALKGLLFRIRPRPESNTSNSGNLQLADYLEQFGRISRAALPVPAAMWNALLSAAQDQDFGQIAYEAQRRSLYRYAYEFYIIAARDGDPRHLVSAADLLNSAGRHEQALVLYKRAAVTSDSKATTRAVQLIKQHHNAKEALEWAREVAETGNRTAFLAIVDLLRETESPQDGIGSLQALSVKHDAGYLIKATAGFMRDLGQSDEAIEWLIGIADAGITFGYRVAGEFLRDAGRIDEAIAAYQKMIEAGSSLDLKALAGLFREKRRLKEAATAFRSFAGAHADLGSVIALDFVDTLKQLQRTDEAIEWLKERASNGDVMAVALASSLIRDTSGAEAAIAWLEELHRAGDPLALGWAIDLRSDVVRSDEEIAFLQSTVGHDPIYLGQAIDAMRKSGKVGEAIRWAQGLAESGHPYAAADAGLLLHEVGRTDEAINWLKSRAMMGDEGALKTVQPLLAKEVGAEVAIAWLKDVANSGIPYALSLAADLLLEANQIEDALSAYRTAAEMGDLRAQQKIAELLVDARRFREALVIYMESAECGNSDSLKRATELLEKQGLRYEAAQLRRYGLEPGPRIADPWEQ